MYQKMCLLSQLWVFHYKKYNKIFFFLSTDILKPRKLDVTQKLDVKKDEIRIVKAQFNLQQKQKNVMLKRAPCQY